MEEQILHARIKDAIRLKNTSGMFKTVCFLSESEIAKVNLLPDLKGEKYAFFGGYEDAERRFFVSLPDWCDDADNLGFIKGFTFNFRSCDKLSHRDFLGAFMSLGITRESIGDIICGEGRCVAFFDENVSKYIALQIEKVGSVGVKISEGFAYPLPSKNTLKEFANTVASLRIDSVIAALIGTSREKAKEFIVEKKVFVNSIEIEKPTFIVPENAKITIRGIGRFIINSAFDTTKKGRIVLKYSKYV